MKQSMDESCLYVFLRKPSLEKVDVPGNWSKQVNLLAKPSHMI